MHVDFLKAVKGGFFLMKKPLEFVLLVSSNSENAVVGSRSDIKMLRKACP
jgi:hypothetical protein